MKSIIDGSKPKININNLLITTSWPYINQLEYYTRLSKDVESQRLRLIRLHGNLIPNRSRELNEIMHGNSRSLSSTISKYALYYYDIIFDLYKIKKTGRINSKSRLLTEELDTFIAEQDDSRQYNPLVFTITEFVKFISNSMEHFDRNFIDTNIGVTFQICKRHSRLI